MILSCGGYFSLQEMIYILILGFKYLIWFEFDMVRIQSLEFAKKYPSNYILYTINQQVLEKVSRETSVGLGFRRKVLSRLKIFQCS